MTATRILAALALLGVLALFVVAPLPMLAGWRAVFVVAEAVPVGAVALLLVARLTGAGWAPALLPLSGAVPWLFPAFLPVVAGQALGAGAGEHTIWLAWPIFAVRGLIALGFWWWLARRLAREGMSELGAGLALAAHGVIVTIIGTDWLLGVAPGQPNSAVGMILGVMQVGAACAAVLVLGLASGRDREDLAKLAFAAALGLSYLVFMDFLIVWYGDLPTRVRFYVERLDCPWAGVPALAVLLGIGSTLVPALARSDRRWAIAGVGLLAALGLASGWEVAGAAGAIGLLATGLAAVGAGAALGEVRR